jgi:GT2 family glycosyltransferase
MAGDVVDSPFLGHYRVRYALTSRPRTSIIIPTHDKLGLLRRCIDSIRQRSSYDNYEIVVVDHRSQDPETLEYLASFEGRVIPWPHEFNFSRMMNFAVQEVEGEALLFLNNDVEVVSEDWIEAMLEHAQRPEVGAVGARLLFPDGSPQHEGILVGPGRGLARNLDHSGYIRLGDAIRDCSAVTAACMVTRRSVFQELGGFDVNLSVDYNDVDFCLRAREKGYSIIYTPCAVLLHEEGSTRGTAGPKAEDEAYFRQRWNRSGPYRDPYYNPNFDLDHQFCLRLP